MLEQNESCPTKCSNFFSKLFHFITNCFYSERQNSAVLLRKHLKKTTALPKEILELITIYAEDVPPDSGVCYDGFEKRDLTEIKETNTKEKLLTLCLFYSARRLDWECNHNPKNYSKYHSRVKSEQEEIGNDFTSNDISTLQSHTVKYCQHYYLAMKKRMLENTRIPYIEEPDRLSPALIV